LRPWRGQRVQVRLASGALDKVSIHLAILHSFRTWRWNQFDRPVKASSFDKLCGLRGCRNAAAKSVPSGLADIGHAIAEKIVHLGSPHHHNAGNQHLHGDQE
jgi:hypothetical protein